MLRSLIFTLLLAVTALVGNPLLAQKKVLANPQAFVKPFNSVEVADPAEDPLNPSNWTQKVRDNDAWAVFVDRENVTAHRDPSESAGVQERLKFGEQYYVLDVEKDKAGINWLELIDCNVDGLKITDSRNAKGKIGWVRSDRLLLWKNSLVSPRTKIHLKAILLNKLDNTDAIDCDNSEIVRAYYSPSGKTLRKDMSLYNVQFVLKEENGRYLLSNTISMSRSNTEYDLIGWVEKERVATWNIRLALEPNFSQEGYDERKRNQELRIKGLESLSNVEAYISSGKINNNHVVTSNDPVNADRRMLAESDDKRFAGRSMRFPLLAISEGNASLPYYRSAVLNQLLIKKGCLNGKMVILEGDPADIGAKSVKLNRYTKAAKKFNVFFVVENSTNLLPYKSSMAKMARELKSIIRGRTKGAVIKFGGVAYKDVKASDNAADLISYSNLSEDVGRFEKFINDTEFKNTGNGEFPAQNYAISEAIQLGNFNPYETNVIIVIGSKGDFSTNRLMKRVYADRGSEVIISKDNFSSLINEGNVNLVAVQAVSRQQATDREFANNLYSVMNEAATKNYNETFRDDKLGAGIKKLMKDVGYQLKPPFMLDPEEPAAASKNIIELENGTLTGSIRRINGNAALQDRELGENIMNQVASITEASVMLANQVANSDHAGIKSGFSPRLIEALIESSGNTNEEMEVTEEKFELYKEVYFAQQPKGAANPLFSYVMFWPEQDLNDYLFFLDRINNSLSISEMSKKREALFDAYCELLDAFSGEKDKDCEDYTTTEIQLLTQGINSEGVDLGFKGLLLKDIKNEKKVDNSTIQALIDEFAKVRGHLIAIQSGDEAEFSFDYRGNTFYWIKMDDIFFNVN